MLTTMTKTIHKLHDIDLLKKARTINKDLQNIIVLLDTFSLALQEYNQYKPVSGLLKSIEIYKNLTSGLLRISDKIIETKGNLETFNDSLETSVQEDTPENQNE